MKYVLNVNLHTFILQMQEFFQALRGCYSEQALCVPKSEQLRCPDSLRQVRHQEEGGKMSEL